MSTVMVPASAGEALDMLESAMGFLADVDAVQLPTEALAGLLQGLERIDAVEAVARGRALAAFDVKGGHLSDGQRSTRSWLVHSLGVTRGQAAEYRAVQGLARGHEPLLAALREGRVVTKSVAVQVARWTAAIPEEFREQAEEILVTAARAGARLRELAAICAPPPGRAARPDVPVPRRVRPARRRLRAAPRGAPGRRRPDQPGGVQELLLVPPPRGPAEMGWQLTVHPDGTSQVKSPSGKIIRSHSPPLAANRPRDVGQPKA